MARAGKVRHAIPSTRWPTRDEAALSPLFSPIRVGPLTLEQRTWVPAMVPWRATDDGEVTDDLVQWYGRFAAGRPGALVVEATGIRDVPSGPLLRIGDDRYLSGLSRIADAVRRHSGGHTRLLIQLIDFLALKRRPRRDTFLTRFVAIDDGHRRRLADQLSTPHWLQASDGQVAAGLVELDDAALSAVLTTREREALDYGYRERVTDLHLPHVRDLPERLPELFARASARAEAAGFDGVELHFAHAYTMAGFLSRLNHRSDGYGGSRAGRARLPLEVYRACRSALGAGVALGCRFLTDEVVEGGGRIEDAVDYAVRFAEAGMDFLSLSKGGKFEDARQPKVGAAIYPYTGPSGHECMPTIYSDARGPFGRNLPLVRHVRDAVRGAGYDTPVIGAGAINTFELAHAALSRGDADIIASARQSLADPDWFAKVREGRGAQIRRCALTNYCEGLDQQHKQVTCRLWDRQPQGADSDDRPRSHDGKRWLIAPPD